VFQDLQSAVTHYRVGPEYQDRTLFVIGGAEIYALSIDLLDEAWLTEIDTEFEGDTRFPGYQNGQWCVPGFERGESRPQSGAHPDGLQYRFSVFRRRPN
jgi:dihydrofolate reductase